MIYAMLSLAMLTILVGLVAIKARLASIRNGQLDLSYFKLMQAENVPDIVTKTTRCFNNLFEIPVLFYMLCMMYIILEVESSIALFLAWLFVISRAAQAFVHVTYNQVKHRMYSFAASVLCVFLLLVNLAMISIIK